MISHDHPPYGAHYDANGDIVLRREDGPVVPSGGNVSERWKVTEPPPHPAEILDVIGADTTEPGRTAEEAAVAKRRDVVRKHIVEDVLREGWEQYAKSLADTGPLLREFGGESASVLHRFWGALQQPVWVPGKKRVRQTNRVILFLTDTLQFGATFAAIFLALFLALNYQSFWQIASARLLPLLTPASVDAPNDALASALQGKLKLIPNLTNAGNAMAGDILSILPLVGPPENRVVIPKLDLNVPLIAPSYEALLAGDWPQVEKDIQDALVNGVVHYPGTANPGQAGDFFVTGHSSYYPWSPGNYKTVFARLQELEIGDEYWVYFGGDKYRYRIIEKKEVSPSDVTVLDQPTDRRLATLMTCTPVGTSLRRLIVVAEEIDPVTGEKMAVGERNSQPRPKVNLESLPI